jgi:hypothetical protein
MAAAGHTGEEIAAATMTQGTEAFDALEQGLA